MDYPLPGEIPLGLAVVEVDPEIQLFRNFGDSSERARHFGVNWDRSDGPQARRTC